MRRLTLHRARSSDEGTLGVLLREDGTRICHTIELPDRANAPGLSCILPGEYVCRPRTSPHLGPVYELLGVPGRSSVLAHRGNWAGDKTKGFRTDSRGCVILGLYSGALKGQRAVMVAEPAVRALYAAADGQPFTLRIAWAS